MSGKNPYRRSLALIACILACASMSAQTRPATTAQPAPTASKTASSPAAKTASLPLGYKGIEIGMTRDEVIAKLKLDPLYAYRGPEDVSLLPSPNQSLIEVAGLSFVKRAFFQFYSGKLWVIILDLDSDKIDHFSVYSNLVAKYGEPTALDPSAATWENGTVRVSIERPLRLRYLDLQVFKKLKDEGEAKASVEELERRDFLGGL